MIGLQWSSLDSDVHLYTQQLKEGVVRSASPPEVPNIGTTKKIGIHIGAVLFFKNLK